MFIGWGFTGYDINNIPVRPKILQGTDMTIQTNENCKTQFNMTLLYDTHICVTGSSTTGACKGDSGVRILYHYSITDSQVFIP